VTLKAYKAKKKAYTLLKMLNNTVFYANIVTESFSRLKEQYSSREGHSIKDRSKVFPRSQQGGADQGCF